MIRRPKPFGIHRKIIPLLRKEFGITFEEYLQMTEDEILMYLEFIEMQNKGVDKTKEEYEKLLKEVIEGLKENRKKDLSYIRLSEQDKKVLGVRNGR